MDRTKSAGSSTRTVIVTKASRGWTVVAPSQPAEAFPTKAAAVAAARDRLDTSGGAIVVHDARGVAETMTIIGGAAARRLNAIEGVRLDLASRNLLRELKADTLTPAKRRAEAVRRFKQAAAG